MTRHALILALLAGSLPSLVARAEPLPHDSGAINVRDYGAAGDGKHDDTEALLKAIAASGGDTGHTFWQDRPVYLPNGVYRVTGTLFKRYVDGRFGSGMMLVGESRAGTVIRLTDHADGFGDAAKPRAVVFTTSKQIDGTPTSGGKDYPRLGEGNDAYMNFVEDMTIDVGHGNPGAIGIDYLANNIGAIRHVTLKAPSDSGAVGLSLARKWPGPALIDDLTVQGFGIGVSAAQTEYGLTFDHLKLDDQRQVAIRDDQNALSIGHLEIHGAAPAVVNSGPEGFIAIDRANFDLSGDVRDLASAVDNRGLVTARDVKITSQGRTVGDFSGILHAGSPWRSAAAPAWHAEPENREPPPPPGDWASAGRFGAMPDTPQVATEALRRAFASGQPTIYLPHGTYTIDDAIEIPASLRRIVGMNSTIRISTQRKPGFSRTGGMLKIRSGGEPLTIEGLAFDNTNQGDQLAIEVSGDRDVVLRDIVSAGVALLTRAPSGGRVFLDDVCCGRIDIAGPRPVLARQLDTEGGGVRIVNRGSPLSILGLKTEGVSTIVDSRDGARTDIFGGLVYMVRDPQNAADTPAFRTADASLSAAFAEEVLRPNSRYRVYLDDGTRKVEAERFPERGLGRFVTDLSTSAAPPSQ